MTRVVPTSSHTSTDTIEHALLHARQDVSHCDRCDEKGDIGSAELDLALESRLINARTLTSAVYDPRDPITLMRTMLTLDYLIREALQLCTLSHQPHKDVRPSLPCAEQNRPSVREACKSIANRNECAGEVTQGA